MRETAEPQSRDDLLRRLGQQLTAGDETALAGVLTHLGPTVELAIRRRLGSALNDADLEDVLSLALTRLWTRRKLFDPDAGRLDAWFYAIARNIAIDIVRERARQARHAVTADASGLWMDRLRAFAAAQSQSQAGRRVLRAALARHFAALSERERRVLAGWLQHRGERGWAAQTAAQLGLSPNHVRVLKHRAMARIQDTLTSQGLDGDGLEAGLGEASEAGDVSHATRADDTPSDDAK